jgi:hypothetical protein
MQTNNAVPPQLNNDTNASQQQPAPRPRHPRKLLICILALSVIIAVTIGVLLWRHYSNPYASKDFTGTSTCISWVKKIEGSNYNANYSLKCTFSPEKIANSSLTAQFLQFSGTPKGVTNCLEDLASALSISSENCFEFDGTVLSNGSYFEGIGGDTPAQVPQDYDYCYSSRLSESSGYPKPSVSDLYFYQGKLYDRYVYKNAAYETKIGTCIINGTTLLGFYTLDTSESFITNVKVAYHGFQSNCNVTGNKYNGENYSDCYSLVTAANASLVNACIGYQQEVSYSGNSQSDFQIIFPAPPTVAQEGQEDATTGCINSYIQRMAALNQCQTINVPSFKNDCLPLISHPDDYTKRVTTPI